MSKQNIVLMVLIIGVSIVIVTALVVFAPVVAPPKSLPARLWSVADSAVFIAVVSTFIAAFAGTWGAQRLAERTARRKELLAEIRGTNAAIGLACNIANTYITTKKQLVRGLVVQYKRQCIARQAHQAGIATGTVSPAIVFQYRMELRTISVPFAPIEELRKILMDKIAPDGKALMLLTPLKQSIDGFSYTVEQRNAWIEEVKCLPDDSIRGHLYFGTPFEPGRTDDRYPNFMKAIEIQTDDCIAFSIIISESLKKYGDRITTQYGQGAPKIFAPEFERAGDLLPDITQYSEWTQT